MRKTLAILLSVVYLAVTSGVAMTVHYCMGEVAAVGIGHSESDKCGDCGMENSGCCHDDFRIVKVSDFHGSPSQPSLNPKADWTATTPDPAFALAIRDRSHIPAKRSLSHAPPDAGGPSLCVLHCVFRI
jgi:hypothetical protein